MLIIGLVQLEVQVTIKYDYSIRVFDCYNYYYYSSTSDLQSSTAIANQLPDQ